MSWPTLHSELGLAPGTQGIAVGARDTAPTSINDTYMTSNDLEASQMWQLMQPDDTDEGVEPAEMSDTVGASGSIDSVLAKLEKHSVSGVPGASDGANPTYLDVGSRDPGAKVMPTYLDVHAKPGGPAAKPTYLEPTYLDVRAKPGGSGSRPRQSDAYLRIGDVVEPIQGGVQPKDETGSVDAPWWDDVLEVAAPNTGK